MSVQAALAPLTASSCMADRKRIIRPLERQYAILRGKFNEVERTVEPIFGVRAILAKWVEIESEKRLLKRRMDQLEGAIREYEPSWEGEQVKPIAPRGPSRAVGTISRRVLAIMRVQRRPMSEREIALIVADQLGMKSPSSREITKIVKAIDSGLNRRLKAGRVRVEGENPKRWSLVLASTPERSSVDVDPVSASSPSSRVRSAA